MLDLLLFMCIILISDRRSKKKSVKEQTTVRGMSVATRLPIPSQIVIFSSPQQCEP